MFAIYFNREEFRCKGISCGSDGTNCGQDTVDAELVRILDDLRAYFDKPIIVTSGNRCEEWNRTIGGSKNSQHVLGRAADIVVQGIDSLIVYNYLDKKYSDAFGFGTYNEFTHVDSRGTKARWNQRV